MATGRRQTSWLYTRAAEELSHEDYPEQIQLVVRARLELRISRFQVWHPDHWATLPPYECAIKLMLFI